MWFENIFRRRPDAERSSTASSRRNQEKSPLFDETFLRRMERLSLQAQRSLRGTPVSGEHPSQWQLPSTVFTDHRPYSSGDDLRYVDWNAYARQETILLKLGEAEQDIDIHMLLDISRSMTWGDPVKMRSAQRLIGALGYLALTHGDRLHVVPFGKTAMRPFGPAQGKRRLIDLLRYIERLTPQHETALSNILQHHARTYQRGGMLVLCSDLLAYENLAEGLRLLQPPRWQVLVLHMLDPLELQPDLQGMIELEDSETGQRLPITIDSEAMQTYQQNLRKWHHWLTRTCARYGATYHRISSAWPLEKKIIPFLRARQLLQ
jgi:uncharacterized protein (DUF58 family)